MKALVGYSGFVGSNLAEATQFDGLYNSQNIEKAYGTRPDLLIYAGVPGTKYLANKYPEKDKVIIECSMENIEKIMPQKLVLISTVDVYDCLLGSTEEKIINDSDLMPYGKHRFLLEEWVKANLADYHIVRLPAIFGNNLKKNYIYDLMHRTPTILTYERYKSLENDVGQYYEPFGSDYVKLCNLDLETASKLESFFNSNSFNSLNFTDSRASYQFYNLQNLYADITTIINNDIRLINLVTEPITAGGLFQYLYKDIFVNELEGNYVQYNLRTKYCSLWGRKDGYIRSAEEMLIDIKEYMRTHK